MVRPVGQPLPEGDPERIVPEYLLHPEFLEGATFLEDYATKHINESAKRFAAAEMPEEAPVTFVLRTKNDGATIEGLLEDINHQDYNGEIEIIAVDTESSDQTRDILNSYGATIISIAQDDFTYPKSLNLGMEAASNDRVFLTVGHANLSNDQTARAVNAYLGNEWAGAYGAVLPGANASFMERNMGWVVRSKVETKLDIKKYKGGDFSATNIALRRLAWEVMDGFDDAFAAGGEDGDLAKRLLRAGGLIAQDPALSAHHSHGLGLINTIQQLRHWNQIGEPLDFDYDAILHRRPDMRRRDTKLDLS